MSDATFYKWRAKFGGMDSYMMKRTKELEEENRRLKKVYAVVVQEALAKEWLSHLDAKRWPSVLLLTTESVFLWLARHSTSARPATVVSVSSPGTIS